MGVVIRPATAYDVDAVIDDTTGNLVPGTVMVKHLAGQGQALKEARERTGAGKNRIKIDDNEWLAIQSGAISASKLEEILNNSDLDTVKELATPRSATVMTPAKTARAQSLLAAGHTQSEVAAALGVPTSTLNSSLNQ